MKNLFKITELIDVTSKFKPHRDLNFSKDIYILTDIPIYKLSDKLYFYETECEFAKVDIIEFISRIHRVYFSDKQLDILHLSGTVVLRDYFGYHTDPKETPILALLEEEDT